MTNATTVTKTTATKTKTTARTTKATKPTMETLTPAAQVLTSIPVSQREVEEIYFDTRNETGIPSWTLVSLKAKVMSELEAVSAGSKEVKVYIYPVKMKSMKDGKLVESWNTAFIQDAVRQFSTDHMGGVINSWTSTIPQVLTDRSGREYQKNISMIHIKRSSRAQAV
jgi:hypothetical protein